MRKMLFVVFVLLAMAMAADTDLVGGYQGQWKSTDSGNGGEFHFVLANDGGTWSCEPGFTLEGSEVKGTTKRLKVEDGKIVEDTKEEAPPRAATVQRRKARVYRCATSMWPTAR